MDDVLICNVGTREVQLDDPSLLPADARDPCGGAPLARLAGAHLRQEATFSALQEQSGCR